MRIRTLLILLAVIAPALPAASPAESQEKGVVRIATQSPLSGGQAARGEALKLGAELAIEQLKGPIERLGFKVELVPFDDQAKPEVAVANARNIIADKNILLVIGHLNGTAIPASEVYKEIRLAMISPASNPILTNRNYANVSRVGGRDDVQGVAGAEFARTLKIKTAYVIHDKTTYGQGVAEVFGSHATKLGIEVVGFEGTGEQSDFDPIVVSIEAKRPDLIYFSGLSEQGGAFFKQAREKGVSAVFMGPDGMHSSNLARIAGKAVVGLYYTTIAGPVSLYPKAKGFARAYKEKFGKDPALVSARAYDAAAIGLKAIVTAIRAAGGRAPSPEGVSSAVRKITHTGITGTFEFDDKGDPRQAAYFVLQVVSDDPARWADNKFVERLEIAAPSLKK